MAFSKLRVVKEITPLGFVQYYLEDRHWWMPIWMFVSGSFTDSEQEIIRAFNTRISSRKQVIKEG